MARARIAHHFPDGGTTEISVSVDETFPDALDEARVQVMHMWREACTDAEAEVEQP